MQIFLIHGMGRTSASMWMLSRRLRAAGYDVHRFDYLVSLQTLGTIAERFRAHIERHMEGAEAGAGYAVIGHSLGGIVTRLLTPDLPPGLRALIMLAPPNRLPVMARVLRRNPLYRLFTTDSGQRLGDPAFYEQLPHPEAPTLVVAGTKGSRASWMPFAGEVNDGVVSLTETELEGSRTFEVEGVHTFLMNRGDVFEAIRDFLGEHAAAAES
jgi:triacylglycerol lipase